MRQGGTQYARDDPVNRETHDFYPTWPAATKALLSVERFDGPIWEPACGDGAMSKVLEEAGYEVISTDLIDRGYGEGGRDFLMEWQPRAPNIVTNPPFRWAIEFVDRALHADHRQGGAVPAAGVPGRAGARALVSDDAARPRLDHVAPGADPARPDARGRRRRRRDRLRLVRLGARARGPPDEACPESPSPPTSSKPPSPSGCAPCRRA
jgi:hypothetical protein